MMDRVNTMAKLEPPDDQSITTLYVGGLTPDMLESDIHVRAKPAFHQPLHPRATCWDTGRRCRGLCCALLMRCSGLSIAIRAPIDR